jgi:hypothetical protein
MPSDSGGSLDFEPCDLSGSVAPLRASSNGTLCRPSGRQIGFGAKQKRVAVWRNCTRFLDLSPPAPPRRANRALPPRAAATARTHLLLPPLHKRVRVRLDSSPAHGLGRSRKRLPGRRRSSTLFRCCRRCGPATCSGCATLPGWRQALCHDRTRWAQRLHAILTHEGWPCSRGALLSSKGRRLARRPRPRLACARHSTPSAPQRRWPPPP